MEKIKLEILGLSSGHSQKGTYTLIMGVENGTVKLPIVIGAFEAQAIALVIEGIKPQRPLTHDLFKNIFDQFQLTLKEVNIESLLEGVFYAKLLCSNDNGDCELDARSSDAIALAVRFNCPIYTSKKIMDEAGIILDHQEDDETPERPEIETVTPSGPKKEIFDHLSIDELEKILEDAIQVEDYDKAAVIRDEITRRRND
jgi:bifunctional DNase/RNase